MREKVLFSWSGGKESAFALYKIKKSPDYEIAALLTTVTEGYDRVSMHGIRKVLLERQADSLGYALKKVLIPKSSSQERYESAMLKILIRYKKEGVSSVVFGDIFLEDIRKKREDNLSKIGMKAVFPLWKNDTRKHAAAFVRLGFKSVITCVDSSLLGKEFLGRLFDEGFLSELPSGVDPSGENGEFHSFVYDGPVFKKPVHHKIGKTCLRDNRFYYCDLIP